MCVRAELFLGKTNSNLQQTIQPEQIKAAHMEEHKQN